MNGPSEDSLWLWMRNEARSIKGLHMHRIEAKDFPDVSVSYKGVSFMLELKVGHVVSRDKNAGLVRFRSLSVGQARWHGERWRASLGGSYVFLQLTRDRIGLNPILKIMRGSDYAVLGRKDLSEDELRIMGFSSWAKEPGVFRQALDLMARDAFEIARREWEWGGA